MGKSPATRALRYYISKQHSLPDEATKPVTGPTDVDCLEPSLAMPHAASEPDLQRVAKDEERIKKGHKKNVSFANIEIRRHNVVIGDHPCCTMGFPLALGWEHEEADVQLPLEDYEAARTPRRSRQQLRTTCEERRELLNGSQSDQEIRRASRKLHRERSCSAKLCERVSEKFFGEEGTV